MSTRRPIRRPIPPSSPTTGRAPRAPVRCLSAPARCCRAASRTMRAISTPIRSTSPRPRARASGTSMATSMSTISAATAPCCSAIRHPAVVEAVKKQMELGTHYGSSHELEVRWAELVCELTPCAEKVRFTASGTEASHMAIRLARAYTGKDKIVRFIGHFHGWHDNVTAGAGAHLRRRHHAGRAAGCERALDRHAERQCRRGREADRGARRHRRGDVRAVGRVVGPGAAAAGLHPGGARRHGEEGRRHADGRGDHRLPLVLGRRAEGVRRHARPLHPGQDRRRRPAGRRGRGQARHPRPHRSRRHGGEEDRAASPIPAPTTPTRCRPPRR